MEENMMDNDSIWFKSGDRQCGVRKGNWAKAACDFVQMRLRETANCTETTRNITRRKGKLRFLLKRE